VRRARYFDSARFMRGAYILCAPPFFFRAVYAVVTPRAMFTSVAERSERGVRFADTRELRAYASAKQNKRSRCPMKMSGVDARARCAF